jgi:DNA-binding transcriptional regulator YiaG
MTNEELFNEERRTFWRECVIAAENLTLENAVAAADILLAEFDERFAPKQDEAESMMDGAALKALRREHNLTLVDIADFCGMSISELSALEHGMKPMTAELSTLMQGAIELAANAMKITREEE